MAPLHIPSDPIRALPAVCVPRRACRNGYGRWHTRRGGGTRRRACARTRRRRRHRARCGQGARTWSRRRGGRRTGREPPTATYNHIAVAALRVETRFPRRRTGRTTEDETTAEESERARHKQERVEEKTKLQTILRMLKTRSRGKVATLTELFWFPPRMSRSLGPGCVPGFGLAQPAKNPTCP